MSDEIAPMPGDDIRGSVMHAVLFHAKSLLETRDVCALLCTSSTIAAVVAHELEDQLTVEFAPKTLQHVQQFSSWLLKNGLLLEALIFSPCMAWQPNALIRDTAVPPSLCRKVNVNAEVCCVYPHRRSFLSLEDSLSNSCSITADSDARESEEDDAAAGAKLGQGLAAADAVASLIHLRSFFCGKELAAVPRLLVHLPTSLTRLQLSWSTSVSKHCGFSSLDLCAPLEAALRRLTGLESLNLLNTCKRNFQNSMELPAMPENTFAPLSKLKSLELNGFDLLQPVIERLPAGLQRLMLSSWRPVHLLPGTSYSPMMSTVPRDLSSLTAVTELNTGGQCLSVYPHVVYPPNLVHLHDNSPVLDVNLKPLKSLQRLGGWAEPDLVLQLGKVAAGLTHIPLVIECSDAAGTHGERVAAQVVAVPDGGGEVTCDLEPVVGKLVETGVASAVRAVWLFSSGYQVPVLDGPVAQQLCRLENLSSLRVHIGLSAEGVAALGGLSSLSKLELFSSGVEKSEVLGIADALTHLPSLHTLQVPEAVRSMHRAALFLQHIAQIKHLHRLELWAMCTEGEKKRLTALLAAAPHIREVVWCGDHERMVERDGPFCA